MVTEKTILKRSLKFKKTNQKTIIIAVAISKRSGENKVRKLSCKNGIPIGETVYDLVTDSYYVLCADFFLVGEVDFGYEIEMNGICYWHATIPLSEPLFKQGLTEQEIQKLESWKSKNPNHWKTQYIQLTAAH